MMPTVMTEANYKIYSMPTALSRVVRRQDPTDGSKWIRDDQWYEDTRVMYFSLFQFLQDNSLVSRQLVDTVADVDSVVVYASDLTDEGKRFVQSGAVARWQESFDRPRSPKKSFSDIGLLKKRLSELR